MRGDPRTTDGHDHGGNHDVRDELRSYHLKTLWIPTLILLLGVWMALSPVTFSHAQEGVRGAHVTESRGLASADTRGAWSATSDVASGILLIVLAALSLRPGSVWPRWGVAVVGTWLVFAPVLLWTPSPAAYVNDTLVGALVISLAVLVPKMPGMILIMQPGPERPEGWSYNPSSWLQRAIVITLSWIGFFAARYLAAYQLGHIDAVWDPFFGNGTERVLESDLSMAFPVSDAGLGSSAILIEALMGYMGSPGRWRTMPWMVTFFGILVVPLGIVHVALVISQPVIVGAWCTFCMVAAGAMLLMIPLAVDEVVAMLQFLIQRVRRGESAWRVFLFGSTTDDAEPLADDSMPHYPAAPSTLLRAAVRGVTVPPGIAVACAVGITAMALPALIGIAGTAADGLQLLGALAASVAIIAAAEIVRAFRWLNVPTGLAIAALGWITDTPLATSMSMTALGALLVVVTVPVGTRRERYGGAERWIA